MALRRRILFQALFAVALLTMIVGGATAWLVARQFQRAEAGFARETMGRVRTMLIQSGAARAKGSTVEFSRSFQPSKTLPRISKMIGVSVEARSKNLSGEWARAAKQLETARQTSLVAFPSGNGTAAWTSGRQSGVRILLRASVPLRLSALRQRILIGLGGALLFGGLLLGSATALVIDKLVLRQLQQRLIEANDSKGDIALAPAPDVSGLTNELAASERKGRESEELFRQMAINASDVLYAMYPESERMEWFGQIDQMLGFANGSFPRTVEAWAEHIHPDEAENIISLYTRSCESGEQFSVEYRMRHRNGSYRTWSHRGKPLFDGNKRLQRVIGACTDITDRKRAEARLRESEEKLSRIVETAANGILICGRDDTITFANPAAEAIFGAGRDEVTNQKYGGGSWRLTRADGGEFPHGEWPGAWAIASGEAVYNIEHSIEQGNGRVVVVSVNAAPIHDDNGEIISAVLGITDVTGRKALEDRLTFQAFHDPLTKLPNRALLMDRLTHAIIRARRSKTGVAVLFLDLDNFKKTNDTLGHDAGDELLKATAERLKTCVRGGDTAARFAGDEFVLLLDNIVDEAGAVIVADRVLKTLMESVEIKGEQVYAPPSIGLALGTPDDSAETVLKRADEAMYLAKRGGKARYVIWREESPVEINVTP
ncbi:MAG TPA: diguanylate cyclase [Abditibacteriaceae bacterium]|jgi:diguanylate cyclase (GGDEF)-like protein/PAS domain S-box-containing protein